MTPAHLDALVALVGPAGLSVQDAGGRAAAVVAPVDRDQCAAVLRWCHETRTPLGLLASPRDDDEPAPQLRLRTDRMQRLRAVSAADGQLVADIGAPLATLQAAAAERGLALPATLTGTGAMTLGEAVHAAAWGSAVLALEVVLPHGRIWQGRADAQASASSAALGALFLAGQGSLGVVTGVTVRLAPPEAAVPPDRTDPAVPGSRPQARPPVDDVALLARIKRALDPNHLLDPGRWL